MKENFIVTRRMKTNGNNFLMSIPVAQCVLYSTLNSHSQIKEALCVISGFRCGIDENGTLLGYYDVLGKAIFRGQDS